MILPFKDRLQVTNHTYTYKYALNLASPPPQSSFSLSKPQQKKKKINKKNCTAIIGYLSGLEDITSLVFTAFNPAGEGRTLFLF